MSSCFNFAKDAKHRIAIQAPTDTPSDYGGFTRTFSTVATLWAIVQPASGKEMYAQQGNQTVISHKFIIRYNSSYSDAANLSDYRIVLDNKNYGIKYLRNLNSDFKNLGKDFTEIYAEENSPDSSTT